MMKFNREEGLTLIELLITIAVIAIVAAISVPVITNVVGSANANAATQTENDIKDFINDGNKSGLVLMVGENTFEHYVDLNGDNAITTNEKISDLVIDTDKFTITGVAAHNAAPTSYTSGGNANSGLALVTTVDGIDVTVAGQ